MVLIILLNSRFIEYHKDWDKSYYKKCCGNLKTPFHGIQGGNTIEDIVEILNINYFKGDLVSN